MIDLVWRREQEQQSGCSIVGVGSDCMVARMGLALQDDFGCCRKGWRRGGNGHDGMLDRRNENCVLEVALRLLLRGLTCSGGEC